VAQNESDFLHMIALPFIIFAAGNCRHFKFGIWYVDWS